jgi:hypothetical protein
VYGSEDQAYVGQITQCGRVIRWVASQSNIELTHR